MDKKELEIILSQLAEFSKPKVQLEQYFTDPAIAADALWTAFLNKHIQGKTIADLGCGPGIFGLGALILGAKRVYFVDVDKDALHIAKENRKLVEQILGKKVNCTFDLMHINEFHTKVQVVLQNPPFGVQEMHNDKMFLLKAMELAPIVYSFHKTSTRDFVEKFVKDHGYKVRFFHMYQFPLKQRYWFHVSRTKYIDVACWCIVKG